MSDQDGTVRQALVPFCRDRAEARPVGRADYAAQLLGAGGGRRGLRGGPVTLQTARGAYLQTEFSGEADRRPPVGLLRRCEI